jgi:hypothetical protein
VSKSDSLSLVILHQAFLYVWLSAHIAHAESGQTSQAWVVMAFPNAVIARHICQSLRQRKSWLNSGSGGWPTPGVFMVQPAVDDWLQYFEGLDLRRASTLLGTPAACPSTNRGLSPPLHVTARAPYNSSLQLLQTTEQARKCPNIRQANASGVGSVANAMRRRRLSNPMRL